MLAIIVLCSEIIFCLLNHLRLLGDLYKTLITKIFSLERSKL